MTAGVFVTGTDTGCGKTHVAGALIRGLRDRGIRVAAFKPVAAGAYYRDGDLVNDDALALAAASGLGLPYSTVNPYCFAPPVAPHIAAAEAGVRIDRVRLAAAFAELAAAGDFVVVEGAGGWRVPLGPGFDIQDLALALGLPVLLVVGLRLGCLNHALLSVQAIRAGGAPLVGWVGTQVDPSMARLEANLETLHQVLEAPCLGVLAHPQAPAADRCAEPLVLDAVLNRC